MADQLKDSNTERTRFRLPLRRKGVATEFATASYKDSRESRSLQTLDLSGFLVAGEGLEPPTPGL
ncbi:protein of unknown function [Bradyrhizobium vignae]|uniref:Uncharacterized protein n=1 Tax=Bradyrhizobium vignae TaxID=1549949 RepID=A0A2U3PV93_9BRAD|nr:protein of unknown function [Bradyrhizobium vignae]